MEVPGTPVFDAGVPIASLLFLAPFGGFRLWKKRQPQRRRERQGEGAVLTLGN